MTAPNLWDIIVEKELSAGNTDVLDGTDLETPPADGVLQLWAGADNKTATIEAATFGHQPGITNLIRDKDTDAIPNLNEDPPIVVMPISKGKRPVITVAGTVSLVHITAIFTRSR